MASLRTSGYDARAQASHAEVDHRAKSPLLQHPAYLPIPGDFCSLGHTHSQRPSAP